MSPNVRKTVMVAIGVAALSMAASATVWAQAEVSAGYDLFTTDPDTTDLLGIPFVGDAGAIPIFTFISPPASADRRRAIGDTDTIVHRQENASVPSVPGTADPIAIELVMLRLVSTIPFDVDDDGMDDGLIYVTLQKDRNPAGEERWNFDSDPPGEDVAPGLRSFGEMTIMFDSAAGGRFDSQLLIFADLRIGSPNGPIVCGVSAGLPACGDFDAGLTLDSDVSAWSRDAVPESITIRGVNFSLAAPDRSDPEDTSTDFWAGVNPMAGTTVCVAHGGHPDPGGLPTAHGTCRTSCTTEAITPNSCRNSKDDDCNGTIDDCDEDLFGPTVTAPADPTPFECPQDEADLQPPDTGFATGTDNCFPPTLPAGNITFNDFRTDGCGQTFLIDRVWTATDSCGNDAAMPDLQQIRVVDTTDPDITCPPDATILWTADRSPASLGSATGSDACGSVGIASNDVDVLGICQSVEITRTWTATDECNRQTTCEQLIHVRGPRDAGEDLKDSVVSLNLPRGIQNALSATLNGCMDSVCRNNERPAVGQLNAFIRQVQAMSPRMIDPADAAQLIAAAQAILDAFSSGGGACPDGCQAIQ